MGVRGQEERERGSKRKREVKKMERFREGGERATKRKVKE